MENQSTININHREFGFVNYLSHSDAQKAVDAMNDKEIAGKSLYVGRAQMKAERELDLRLGHEKIREEKLLQYQSVNLYVKNIDEAITEANLRDEFSVYGQITSAKIMLDEKNVSKGFGFVCFTNPDEATKAVTEMNGFILNNKPLYVALAQRKDARRAQLGAQMQQRNMRQNMPGPNGFPGQPQQMFYPPRNGFYPSNQPQQMMQRPMSWNGPGGQQGAPRPQQMQQFPPQQFNGMPARPQNQQRPRGGPSGRGGQGHPQQHPQMMGRQQMPQQMHPMQQMQARPRPAGYKYPSQQPMQPRGPISSSDLSEMSADEQKRYLGENLFPQVQAQSVTYAGKITGMLLQMDNSELLHLLESPETLKEKVNEAVRVLELHIREQQKVE